ncbi:hypothetical protein [Alloscardovia macacae]|uniref:Peptidase n=1 Tax=Alloscardovia macacae TaxID=1160091 RepID=A0A261F7B1_9BIFI|nr:hypothetical protein [Alloscardovia macacae]OZG55017.1 hypothetical protein ALMA_0342 [Alloscardovia macacae]
MNKRIHAVGALLALLLACLFVLPGALPQASAKPTSGTLKRPDRSTYMMVPGFRGYALGPIAIADNGDRMYCHEWGVTESMTYTNSTPLPDSADTRAAGYLIQKYQHSPDALIQAALALNMHDHFDLASSRPAWDKDRPTVIAKLPQVLATAQELWAEGQAHAVAGTQVSVQYAQAQRRGQVSVRVTNASGTSVEGVPVKVQLSGPALFDSTHTASATVTSGRDAVTLSWTATGEGEVSVTQQLSVQTLDDIESAQNFVRLGDAKEVSFEGVRFHVKKAFRPILSTHVPGLTLEAGSLPSDTVHTAVAPGDAWEEGVTLNARGYFFAGLSHEAVSSLLNRGVTAVKPGEKAADYLQRLEDAGLTPVATAQVDVSEADAEYDVVARDFASSAQRYELSESDRFSSWVWTIAAADQSSEARGWIDGDAISGLLDVKESISTRRHLMVDSTVTEHSAFLHEALTDRITVSGYPSDHGAFAGNAEFGWTADTALAQVSVYWSKEKPSREAVPELDDEHELLGTWDYAAVNGVIAVGGGKPDAHGKPVHIYAQKQGYYAFVYSFAGDDRVMPVQSAWNDEWEYTHVMDVPVRVEINTHVSDTHVDHGEDFHDVARITGDVPEGAYVTFDAYDAVESSSDMGSSELLTRGERVPVRGSDRDADGSYVVESPAVHTESGGTVYWKATVWNPGGEVLASHGLGVPGESTEVTPPPAPEVPPVPAEPEPKPEPPTPPTPSEPPVLAKTGVSIGFIPLVGMCASGGAFFILCAYAVDKVRRDNAQA